MLKPFHSGTQCREYPYPEVTKCSVCQNLELQHMKQLNPENQSYIFDNPHERTCNDILSSCLSQLASEMLHTPTLIYNEMYEGWLEMIWPQLIYSDFIIIRLNNKQLLALNIPLLGYISLGAPDGFIEPSFRCAAIPLTDCHLSSFLANAAAPYPVEDSAACRCFLSTDCR
jgi:hypothetical protein